MEGGRDEHAQVILGNKTNGFRRKMREKIVRGFWKKIDQVKSGENQERIFGQSERSRWLEHD